MESRFHRAADFLLLLEGFESDDPNDHGGATRYGISLRLLRVLPDADGDGFTDGDLNHDGQVDARDVRLVSRLDALTIYSDEFWTPCRCDELPPGLDMAVFGAAVNHGVGRSVKMLQQALRVAEDGVIGPITLRHARAANQHELLLDLLSIRAVFYHWIAQSDRTQEKFLRGWQRRLFNLQAWIIDDGRNVVAPGAQS